jgi:drug/metabolite transporter (DMT)-like permease
MVKLAYHGFTPAAAALLRCLCQIPITFLVLKGLGKPLHIDRKVWKGVAIGGAINSGVYMILFMEGMKRTSAGQGAIALATAPIFVAVLSGILGQEKVTWKILVGSLIAFVGVGIAESGSHGLQGGDLMGTLLCLLSAFVWAISVSFLRTAIDSEDAMTVFAWSLVAASVVLIPYGFYPLLHTRFDQVAVEGWVGFTYMVLMAGVGGFTAYYLAIAKVGASRASMTSYVIPIVAAFAAWPLLGTSPSSAHLMGLALVLCGVGFVNWNRRPAPKPVLEGESLL